MIEYSMALIYQRRSKQKKNMQKNLWKIMSSNYCVTAPIILYYTKKIKTF